MAIPDNTKAREERKKEEKAPEGNKLVIDGAIIQCNSCMVPMGQLKVNFDTPTIQYKKTATVMEKSPMSLQFSGNCMKSPKMEIPCKAYMQLGEWQDVGTMKVQNKAPLLLKSTIPCIKGDTIKIVDCGQKNVPTNIDVKGAPVPMPELEIKVLKDCFLPLGIANFKGENENDTIKFEVFLRKGKDVNVTFFVKHNGETIFTKKIDEPMNAGSKKRVEWDGFSDGRIYDSTIFIEGDLTAEVSGNGAMVKKKIPSEYRSVEWVDIKIDNNTKKIDVTLRVNLWDGGANGLEDFDIVSKKAITSWGFQPYKSRHITFEQLKNQSLKGLNDYWSRNKTNNAKNKNGGVNINEIVYEVNVLAINVVEKSMPSPEIIYWTNVKLNFFQRRFGVTRSRNWFLSRKLIYICGYYYEKKISESTDDWWFIGNPDDKFIETSAHEIGHEILTTYQGFFPSIEHKGSSTILQDPNGSYSYPESGEIDIMKYVPLNEFVPKDYFSRVVADEADVIGLLWCSKIYIK